MSNDVKGEIMKKLLFAIFAAALLVTGCNKEINSKGGPGWLSVKITDDPLDINTIESAEITISKIEIRKAGADEEAPFLELPMEPVTINVFELRNGLTEELVNLEVPQGDYDLVRIYVDEATLKLKDIAEPFNMKVPSGQQTGIKVFVDPGIHVEGGISAELLLDFDLANSFVMRGHDAHNGFIFKPVIKATNTSVAGRIEGTVKDNSAEPVAIENADLVLKNGTTEVGTAKTDATGFYAFPGVLPGTYSITVTKTNYDGASADGIVVVIANKTTQNFVLKALPVYKSSVIEKLTPTALDITFSLALDNTKVPEVGAFAVMVAGAARTVNTVAVAGTKVTLTLSSAVTVGQAVTVAYTKPATNPLQTTDGLQVPSFTAQTVTNKTE